MLRAKKIIRLFNRYILSSLRDTPLFLHISPTRRCNLTCSYCYQHDNTSHEMSFEDFKDIVNNLNNYGLGIVSFTGGEPLLWNSIIKGIKYCDSINCYTQLTTNGTLLDEDLISSLKNAGLDYLMVSIDSYNKSKISQKTVYKNPRILNLLSFAASQGLAVSVNTVLTNNNFSDSFNLIRILQSKSIPISIGLLVEPQNNKYTWNADIYRIESEESSFIKIINKIISLKQKGYYIIEPEAYFREYSAFRKGDTTWDCKIAKRSTIQVSPTGKVYVCSKLNELTNLKASKINRQEFINYKEKLNSRIDTCNKTCYSNCAYNSYYYSNNKTEFLRLILRILFHQKIKLDKKISKYSKTFKSFSFQNS